MASTQPNRCPRQIQTTAATPRPANAIRQTAPTCGTKVRLDRITIAHTTTMYTTNPLAKGANDANPTTPPPTVGYPPNNDRHSGHSASPATISSAQYGHLSRSISGSNAANNRSASSTVILRSATNSRIRRCSSMYPDDVPVSIIAPSIAESPRPPITPHARSHPISRCAPHALHPPAPPTTESPGPTDSEPSDTRSPASLPPPSNSHSTSQRSPQTPGPPHSASLTSESGSLPPPSPNTPDTAIALSASSQNNSDMLM